jgi:hypothetical protein
LKLISPSAAAVTGVTLKEGATERLHMVIISFITSQIWSSVATVVIKTQVVHLIITTAIMRATIAKARAVANHSNMS